MERIIDYQNHHMHAQKCQRQPFSDGETGKSMTNESEKLVIRGLSRTFFFCCCCLMLLLLPPVRADGCYPSSWLMDPIFPVVSPSPSTFIQINAPEIEGPLVPDIMWAQTKAQRQKGRSELMSERFVTFKREDESGEHCCWRRSISLIVQQKDGSLPHANHTHTHTHPPRLLGNYIQNAADRLWLTFVWRRPIWWGNCRLVVCESTCKHTKNNDQTKWKDNH